MSLFYESPKGEPMKLIIALALIGCLKARASWFEAEEDFLSSYKPNCFEVTEDFEASNELQNESSEFEKDQELFCQNQEWPPKSESE